MDLLRGSSKGGGSTMKGTMMGKGGAGGSPIREGCGDGWKGVEDVRREGGGKRRNKMVFMAVGNGKERGSHDSCLDVEERKRAEDDKRSEEGGGDGATTLVGGQRDRC
ncbi:hypothetical protein L6452_02332 [Arctium lappa]|uniref:Uncharacterized protein n=1 Tax=Arctium lappa TaxID=4217 RepID=A0ACB9FIK2_ARCLA|nr:hypothetical protein L6452_02332 [Arctium lappa]